MPALILLAGGKSTRFGRPKQLEPVGPRGEALLDLTLRDAFAAGCTDAVIVVRPQHGTEFAERFVEDRRVRIIVQHEARGTAHAVMLALDHVHGTAITANGDDHYGKEALQLAVDHALHADPQVHALVAFHLANTLSPGGGVNRAVCTTDIHGSLLFTEEVTGLYAGPDGISGPDGRTWPPDTMVSMNLWVFRPALFPLFRTLYAAHVPTNGEFGLPNVVADAIAQQHRFVLVRTAAQWCGLTHPADAEIVRRELSRQP